MPRPTFSRERKAIAQGLIVCGVDEAGRGPIAGPVVAAAVILDPKRIPRGLNDSKVLSETKRDALYDALIASADCGVGIVQAPIIDSINILQATFHAMKIAVSKLHSPATLALVDGNRAPLLPCTAEMIVDGDATCLSIGAASIIAKVTRDRLMCALHETYPQYGFNLHKGYGTEIHLAALAEFGPCPEHRCSFAPLRLALEAEEVARQMKLGL
jgi:ribonuclease HII